jgi:hypothetical protein
MSPAALFPGAAYPDDHDPNSLNDRPENKKTICKSLRAAVKDMQTINNRMQQSKKAGDGGNESACR